MRFTTLGQSDIKISRLIMGTWQAGKTGHKGRSQWLGIEDSASLAAMRAAYDKGVTTFDTAYIYGQGHAEKLLGQALGAIRDKVVIASKMHPLQCGYDQVFNSCHLSLRNLGTDYMDVYQIHFPSGSFGATVVPIEETMKALLELKAQGKIRAIGVSNFTLLQLKEALLCGPIESVQLGLSLFWRQAEKEMIPFCQQNKISVLAYSSLAQGLLTGKFVEPLNLEEGDNRKANRLFQKPLYTLVQEALTVLRPVAEKKKCSLSQLALSWVMAQPSCAAIVGVRSSQQMLSNIKAFEVDLNEQDIKTLNEASKIVMSHLGEEQMMWH